MQNVQSIAHIHILSNVPMKFLRAIVFLVQDQPLPSVVMST